MAIIINRNGETVFGQYAKGDVVLNLAPHQENLLLEMGQAQPLSDSDVLVVLASGVLIAPEDVAAAGLTAGVLLKHPSTGLLYGQSDGAGGYAALGESAGGGAVEQFGVVHAGLVPLPYRITSTGAPAGLSTPCLVESIMCIAPGSSGTLTIHDDVDAADATKLRLSIAYTALTAGQVYPLAGDGAAVVFETGAYVTCTGSGIFVLNAVPEVA